MLACLTCEGAFVSLVCEQAAFAQRRKLDAGMLAGLARRYAGAREGADDAALLAIGHELYAWLDGAEGWLGALWRKLIPPFVLEVRAPLHPDDDAAWTVLHAPWELLADKYGFLAGDAERPYAPARRLGDPAAADRLDGYRLGIAFMAAAPRGAVELDYEAEEAAIMGAAGQNLDLFVEESGDPEELGRRLADLDPPPQVLHLSCHGHNAWTGHDGKTQPVLMLEDPTGAELPITAGALLDTLGDRRPRLLFLSACLTAAAGRDGPEMVSESLAGRLTGAGLPAVLGWDGTVADVAATTFARELYDELGRRMPPALAAAAARRALLNGSAAFGGETASKDMAGDAALSGRLAAEAKALRRDWHLARVWLGPVGGGAIVGGKHKRSLLPLGSGHKKLLKAKAEEKLEVADPAMFVGRRRQLQAALHRLADGEHGALLLHGMGRLGKSSLAARIADRRPDLTFAVVFGDYDALSVFEAVAEALKDYQPAQKLLDAGRAKIRKGGAATLERWLVNLLAGPCQQADGGRPLLLLVDDLERILEPDPAGGRHRVRLAERPVLAALLRTFDPARSDSRLLLTSRFPFALVEDGKNLAATLAELELGEFSDKARQKLALRQVRAVPDEAGLAERLPLLERTQTLARGNPGLQDLLGAGLVLRPGVTPKQAAATLDEVQAYLQGGALPRTEAVRRFLEQLGIDALRALAGPSGQALLRGMTLFQVPVPETVIAALAAVLGGQPARLCNLGLLVPAEDLVEAGTVALAVNGLAAGRLAPLSEDEQAALAPPALAPLFAAWGGAEDRLSRPYAAEIELTRLALLAGDAAVVAACSGFAVAGLAALYQPAIAGALGQQAIALLEAAGRPLPLRLLAETAEALQSAGDGAAADAVLAKGGAELPTAEAGTDLGALGRFLFAFGKRQRQGGDPEAALATFERLCEVEIRRDNKHQWAVARGSIADILQDRGELDEALRIRREEELPVYTRLGDVRSVAITQGKIAGILMQQGDLDGALALQEERLDTNRRLGNADGIASGLWDIARIELTRQQYDQAIPRLMEAWRIFEHLQRAEGLAVVGSVFGQVLAGLGLKEEALAVLRRSAGAFRKLGRVDEAEEVEALIATVAEQP
jgi:tetratricopeptide (TPR) repeat protein